METTAGDVGVGVVGGDAGVPLAQAAASATNAHEHKTIRGEGDVGLRCKRFSADKRGERGLNTFSGYQRPRSSGIRAGRAPRGRGVANAGWPLSSEQRYQLKRFMAAVMPSVNTPTTA